jgi:nitrogen fixation/metabolism regulation signal transduction histidine kinase
MGADRAGRAGARPRRRREPPHETRVLRLALVGGLPALLVALWWLWLEPHPLRVRVTLTIVVVGTWLGVAAALRERVVRPLQTLSNLIAAVREGDFGIRARGAGEDDALGLALHEVNSLAETLRAQRLRAMEADALLRRVTEEIDVAVFAFDAGGALRLVNRAGEQALARPAAAVLGETADALGLGGALEGESPRLVELALPGARGRWEARHGAFRLGGHPHTLLVLTDVSRALRAEERAAWQRLVRVLGHEINNSLAPIKSLAGMLRGIAGRAERPDDWEEDLRSGLGVIEGRADALQRFMAAYAALARLPDPRPAPLDVDAWVRRVAALETRLSVRVRPGRTVEILADGDQLDQLLINLIRNAADAALETGGGVEVGWSARDGRLEVLVDDEGPGLSGTTNLFTPFFTTKPGGSGIGLALSRQIAEAHGGTLTLEPRTDGRGARARLVLPA